MAGEDIHPRIEWDGVEFRLNGKPIDTNGILEYANRHTSWNGTVDLPFYHMGIDTANDQDKEAITIFNGETFIPIEDVELVKNQLGSPDLVDIPTQITTEMYGLHAKVINDAIARIINAVLCVHLPHIPTQQDFDKLTFLSVDSPACYERRTVLLYDGTELGRLDYDFTTWPGTLTFKPSEQTNDTKYVTV